MAQACVCAGVMSSATASSGADHAPQPTRRPSQGRKIPEPGEAGRRRAKRLRCRRTRLVLLQQYTWSGLCRITAAKFFPNMRLNAGRGNHIVREEFKKCSWE